MALSPHPFDSTFRGFDFIGNFIQILGHLIALLVNVSWGSITTTNVIMYFTNCSSVLGIYMVYCTLSRIWNCVANCYSSSFYCMATWSIYVCKLWVTTWFLFIAILPFFFGIFFCHRFILTTIVYSYWIPNKISYHF
jgi:hypothetical protein